MNQHFLKMERFYELFKFDLSFLPRCSNKYTNEMHLVSISADPPTQNLTETCLKSFGP